MPKASGAEEGRGVGCPFVSDNPKTEYERARPCDGR